MKQVTYERKIIITVEVADECPTNSINDIAKWYAKQGRMMVDDIINFTSEELGRAVTEDELMEDIKQDFDEDAYDDDELLKEELDGEEGFTPNAENDLNPVAFLERKLDKEDKISTSNLTDQELGRPVLSVRFWRQYASVFDGATLYDMPLVYLHMLKKAKINEATSLSRDAKAIELAFTQKRVRQRTSSQDVNKFLDHIKKREGGQ